MNAVRSTFFVSTISGLILILLAAIGAFQAWLHVDHAAEVRTAEAIQAADLMRTRAERVLQSKLSPLQALAAFVDSQPTLDPAEFSIFVAALMRPGVNAVLLMPDGGEEDLLAGAPAQAAIGRSLLRNREQRDVITQAMVTRRMAVSDPISVDGRRMLAAYDPIFIYRDGATRYWGLATILIDLDAVLAEIGLPAADPALRYTIRSVGRDVAEPHVIAGASLTPEVTRIASFAGGAWEVGVVPAPARGLGEAALHVAGPAGTGALLVLALVFIQARARGSQRAAITNARISVDVASIKLGDAQARLRTALDTITEGFACYDRDDRLVVCNERYRQMYDASAEIIRPGVPFEDVIRHGVAHGQYPDAGADPEEFVARRLAFHREAGGGRSEMRLSDGRWVMVAEHRTPDGGVVGIRTDITELKRRSLEIEGQQIMLRATLESLNDGVAVFDDEGLLALWNSRFAVLADIDPVCLERGIGLAALVAVQGRDGILGDEDIVFAARGQDHLDDARLSLGRRNARSGKVVRVELCWTAAGQTVLSLVDDTEVARAGDILATSEQRLRDILDVSPIGIAVFDREGHPLFSNDRHCEMLGLSRAEIGSYAGATAFIDPADLQAMLLSLRDHGVMAQREIPMRRPDGRRLWVSMSARNLIYSGQKATICHLFDVTALKEGRVARTPAAVIEGLADEIEAPCQYVIENLRYLRACIDDVLALARRAGHHDVEALADEMPAAIDQSLEGIDRITQVAQAIGDVAAPSALDGAPFDLNRAIRAALTATGRHWRYAARVDLDLDDDLPLLRGDLGDLHHMLMAAITGTARTIDRRGAPELGQIRIATRLTRDMIELTITDSGAAMHGWEAVMRSAELLRLGGQVEVDAAAGAALRILLPLQEVSVRVAA